MTVAESLQAGVFRPELQDAEMVAQTLWAGVHGMVSLEITKQSGEWIEWRSVEQRCDFMLEVLFRGLTVAKE